MLLVVDFLDLSGDLARCDTFKPLARLADRLKLVVVAPAEPVCRTQNVSAYPSCDGIYSLSAFTTVEG